MILVTGAAGKTGQALLRALARRGARARALVHKSEDESTVRSAGAVEAARGDLLEQESLERAAAGVDAIYHICPNLHPQELEIGERVIAAARAGGVARCVYHSVLRPQIEAMPHHWRKMRVEQRLWDSGFDVTVLQPAALMQNLLAHWPRVKEEGTLPVPYSPRAVFTLVDLGDVAEAAATVLTERGHGGATYELCGPLEHSHAEVAEILSSVLGRPVEAVEQPPESWRAAARAGGLDAPRLEALSAMFRYYHRHGFIGNGKTLRMLLGREGTTLRALVEAWSAGSVR